MVFKFSNSIKKSKEASMELTLKKNYKKRKSNNINC
jgi:hypothetical protein